MMDGILLNPFIIGSAEYIPIRITAKQRCTGITDPPYTRIINAHGLIENKKFGPIITTGIQVFSINTENHVLIYRKTLMILILNSHKFVYKVKLFYS